MVYILLGAKLSIFFIYIHLIIVQLLNYFPCTSLTFCQLAVRLLTLSLPNYYLFHTIMSSSNKFKIYKNSLKNKSFFSDGMFIAVCLKCHTKKIERSKPEKTF